MSENGVIFLKLLIGFAVGTAIAYLAYRAQALDRRGAVAAALLGTVIIGLGGAGWAVILLTFFISASLLSRLFGSRKVGVGEDFAKGVRRDAGQVLANGGVAGVLVLFHFILTQVDPESGLLPALWLGFAASLAGANADTWGTELGILNPRKPVLITNFRQVPKGTSGAISLAGSLAAVGGAALVGGAAAVVVSVGGVPERMLPLWSQFLIVTLGGTAGAFIDSVLGGTVQAMYYCSKCQKETERHPKHICGTPTVLKRGLAWLGNDWVNAACTLSAGFVGMILGSLF